MSVENLLWTILGFGAGVTLVLLAAGWWLYDIFKDDVFGADGVDEHEDIYEKLADDIVRDMAKRPNRS